MNQKEINRKLNQMKSTVLVIEERLQDFFRQNSHVTNTINPIFVRNVVYINSVVDNIAMNLQAVSKYKSVDDENREEIEKRMATSTYLIKYLVDMTKAYSIIDNDYEVHNLILRKNNMPSVLTNIPQKYKEAVKEEFTKISKERKVIEGFSLKPITSFFSKIGKGFMMIIKTIGKIGKFIGQTLVKFIKFMFKLIKIIAKLIFVTLPRLIKKTAFFIKDLIIKLAKVGLISAAIFVLMILVLLKYWQSVLDTLIPPLPLVLVPAILITLYLFWNETNALWRLQLKILRSVLNFFTGAFKEMAIFIFGLDRRDKFFRYKISRRPTITQVLTKAKLFMIMIAKNIASIVARTLIFILILKNIILHSVKNFGEGVPTFRDLLLFPVVIIRFLIQIIF